MIVAEKTKERDANLPPLCSDLDESCVDIPDKLHCWLYDPMKGSCPWLCS